MYVQAQLLELPRNAAQRAIFKLSTLTTRGAVDGVGMESIARISSLMETGKRPLGPRSFARPTVPG